MVLRTSARCSFMNRRNSSSHLATLLAFDLVEIALGAGVDDHHLIDHVHRPELRLLEHFDHAVAAIELSLASPCPVRCRAGRTPPVRGTRPGPDASCRRFASWPGSGPCRRRATRGCRRRWPADAGEEQVGLQVNLAVGDRNHVGRNVRRHFAFQGFDHRQRRQRAAGAGNLGQLVAREFRQIVLLGVFLVERADVNLALSPLPFRRIGGR